MSLTREFLDKDMKDDNDKRHELMFECQFAGSPQNLKLYNHLVMMIEKNRLYVNSLFKEREYLKSSIQISLRRPCYPEDIEYDPDEKIRYLERLLGKYRMKEQFKFDDYKLDDEETE